MPPVVTRPDVLGVIGTSLSSGFGASFGWFFNFMRAIKAKFGPYTSPPARPTGLATTQPRVATTELFPAGIREATGYQAQKYPSYFMDAVPGRRVTDISGSMNAVLAPFIAVRTTIYFAELGENDIPATPAATFIPAINAIRDATRAAPYFKALVWCSPFSTFEDWPDGANAFDLVVDGHRDKETQIAACMAAFSDCYHVSWRQLRLSALNATTNPGHLSTGVYTFDGTHPTNTPQPNTTVSGGDLLANYTASQLSFA